MSKVHVFLPTLLVVVLLVPIKLSAAKPEDFSTDQLQQAWHELWQSGDPAIKEPHVDKLSDKDALQRLVRNWTVQFGIGPANLSIAIRADHSVELSGKSDDKPWKKTGQWRVVSDKLVLFLKEDDIPSFLFQSGAHLFVFDPWSKTLTSELKAGKDP